MKELHLDAIQYLKHFIKNSIALSSRILHSLNYYKMTLRYAFDPSSPGIALNRVLAKIESRARINKSIIPDGFYLQNSNRLKKSYALSVGTDFPCSRKHIDFSEDLNESFKMYFIEDKPALQKFLGDLSSVPSWQAAKVICRTKIEYNYALDHVNPEISSIFSYVPSIDSDLDELVYRRARSYASTWLNKFCKNEKVISIFGIDFSDALRNSSTAVADRLVPYIRNLMYLERDIRRKQRSKIELLSSTRAEIWFLTFYLAKQLGVEAVAKGYFDARLSMPTSLEEIVEKSDNSIRNLAKQPLNVARYDFACKGSFRENLLIWVALLNDPQYREACLPLVKNIDLNSNDSICILQPHKDLVLDDVDDVRHLNGVSMTSVVNEKQDPVWASDFINLLLDSINDFINEGSKFSYQELLARAYIFKSAQRTIYVLVLQLIFLARDIDQICDRTNVSGIVSQPGRLHISQFLTSYLDVPTFEIQSGTLSFSNRYSRPNSKYIFAIDSFSRSVYEKHGVPKNYIHVVGNPRIDQKLSCIRGFTKEQSRSILKLDSRQSKIICIATQPVKPHAQNMVSAVAKAVKNMKEFNLVISMHPGEGESYSIEYKEVLDELMQEGRAMITKGDTYQYLNASDYVVTYFSTCGLEAFCLGKPVFTYHPAEVDHIPFDLEQIGVAQSFDCSNQLIDYLLIPNGVSTADLSPELSALQDGRSVERICKFIKKHSL